jgi:predicted AlkP superfamily pyrophosphatase or phosphodiesterase
VLGFLLDGVNPNVLYEMIDAGDLPHLGRIADRGTTFRHGAVSSLPTVTLANHTSALTGCHPGHHGILHNAWWDREARRQIITNDATAWANAMAFLAPGVESIHDAVRRTWPGELTASINEPADAGAGYSTFDLMRRRVRSGFPKTPDGLPHATERFVRPFKDYAWYTQVDHHGVLQATGVIGGRFLDTEYPMPRYLWMNFTLTDSAFHEGGPHSDIARASVRDTDGRIGDILDALDQRGVLERCAFYLVADHGMETSNPAVTGDWDAALRAGGVDFRDEAYGFVYLNP